MDEITPYGTPDTKKEQVRTMFNNIANKYDFLNRTLSLGVDKIWRKILINKLAERHPENILDMATGTGDVALLIAKKLPAAKVVGVDLANEMLEIARTKNEKLGASIKFHLGDSENIDFTDNSFDACTVAFGVRNFEDPLKGLSEIFRVLQSEGRLLVLEFSKPRIFPFKQLYHMYFKFVLPTIGRMTSKDPKAYTYLFESVQRFPEGKTFGNLMKKAGFQNIIIYPLTFGICSIYIGRKK